MASESPNIVETNDWLKAFLERYPSIPGASVAIIHNDMIRPLCAGVTNVKTSEKVTSDTLFQISSISETIGTLIVWGLVFIKSFQFKTKKKGIFRAVDKRYFKAVKVVSVFLSKGKQKFFDQKKKNTNGQTFVGSNNVL